MKEDQQLLIVDDHVRMGYAVRNTLGLKPDQICFAESPANVQGLLEEHRFDLFLLDYQLPEISGIELADQLREGFPHIPQTIITAYKDKPLIEACKQRGIPYVEKPFWNGTLKDTVDFYLSISPRLQQRWQKFYPVWEQRWGKPDTEIEWLPHEHKDHFWQLWSDQLEKGKQMALRYIKQPEEAQDIAETALLKLLDQNVRFKGSLEFIKIFLTAVKNDSMNWQKKKKPEYVEQLPEVVDDSPSPFDTLAKQQMLTKFEVMLQQLPEKDRTVLQLYCENKSYRQIAKETGLTVEAVKKRIQRVVKKMENN